MSASLLVRPTVVPVTIPLASQPLTSEIKKKVQAFWERSPCDSWFTAERVGTPAFYRALDEHRYRVHPRLCSSVAFERTCGLRVLEIGCGCGSEAERFARAGAHYTAIDLTKAALRITRQRFRLAKLHGCFVQGDAESLPFPDGAFDFVYSHGVLHHTPDTPQAIREIYRVLSPGGRAAVMLYHRNSFNFHVNVRVLRRLRIPLLKSKLGIKLTARIWNESAQDLQRHATLLRQDPEYSRLPNMLNRNTDGPDNPLSQVFSKAEARRMFGQFANVKTEVMFWNPRWLPFIGTLLPQSVRDRLESACGWHLWIYAQKHEKDSERKTDNAFLVCLTRTSDGSPVAA